MKAIAASDKITIATTAKYRRLSNVTARHGKARGRFVVPRKKSPYCAGGGVSKSPVNPHLMDELALAERDDLNTTYLPDPVTRRMS
jgi:hypothetical protein